MFDCPESSRGEERLEVPGAFALSRLGTVGVLRGDMMYR